MRVAQLIDSLAPGGAEQSLVALAPELVQRGIDVRVGVLGQDDTLAPALHDAGIDVTFLDGRRSGVRFRNMRLVRRWIAAMQPDLVHTTLYESDVAGRAAAAMARVPVVSSLVNVAYSEQQIRDPRLSRFKVRSAQALDMLTARRAARFCAVNDDVADTMSRRLRIARARVDVIHRGRSAATLGERSDERRSAARRALGLGLDASDDAVLVLAAARHEHQKGLDVLLRAVPDIVAARPGVHVAIAGRRGNATSDLDRLIDDLDLGDVVQLLGARSDVHELMTAADVFVLPSRWEGFAGVILEAMALEAPIVATGLPVARETLAGDLGRIVPIDDPAALARAILATVDDPDESRRRAVAARQRFLDRYEIGAIADATVTFYECAVRR